MRFVLRIQAWQCINDKILQGTKHTYTLPLSLERNENSYRTFVKSVCVCVCAFSGIPTFLSFLSISLARSLSLLASPRCFSAWQQQKMKRRRRRRRRRSTIHSVYYLVGWFFSPHRSLCTSSLLACCASFLFLLLSFSPLLSSRFVDKRPRKGRGRPIGRREASNFFLQVMVMVGGLFCSSPESSIQYPLLSLLLPLSNVLSLSLSPRSLLLPVLVCKSSPCSTHTHGRTRSKTRLTPVRYQVNGIPGK